LRLREIAGAAVHHRSFRPYIGAPVRRQIDVEVEAAGSFLDAQGDGSLLIFRHRRPGSCTLAAFRFGIRATGASNEAVALICRSPKLLSASLSLTHADPVTGYVR